MLAQHHSIFLTVKAFLFFSLIFAYTMSYACSDSYCESSFTLDNRNYNSCQINFPLLDSGNDSQTNLYLLLADKGYVAFQKSIVKDDSDLYANSFPFDFDFLQESVVSKVTPLHHKKTTVAKSHHYYDEHCQTVSSGLKALHTALYTDTNIATNEKKLLLNYRKSIDKNCTSNKKVNDIISFNLITWSERAQPYADYIKSSNLFYKKDFLQAYTGYKLLHQKLLHSKNHNKKSWLAETSQYMLLRTSINQAYQSGKDTYGFVYLNKINPEWVTTAERAITEYLKNYPNGRYSASARGLLRRTYWLVGNKPKLIKEIDWQLSHTDSPQFNIDFKTFTAEIDRRILSTVPSKKLQVLLKNPLLLAVHDLQEMRIDDLQARGRKPISLKEIKQQAKAFQSEPQLFEYLHAMHFYVVQKNPKKALQYLPTDNLKNKHTKLNYLNFSRYVLKARIQEQLGQTKLALQLWQRLNNLPQHTYQSEVTQLALALNAQKTKNFDVIFGKKPAVTNTTLLKKIVKFNANASLLKKIIHSRAKDDEIALLARFTLLIKSLHHKQYSDFLRYQEIYSSKNYEDYKGYYSKNTALKRLPVFSLFDWQGAKIGKNIHCGDLTTTVKKLSKNSHSRLQQICLSEFMSQKGSSAYVSDEYSDYYANKKDSLNSSYQFSYLGDVKDPFKGKFLERHDIYQYIIKQSKKDDLTAYALHRAISCYASSGNNQCGGNEVDKTVRKKWYKRLKKQFPLSPWAKKQKYYW